MNDTLEQMLEQARQRTMSPEESERQRVSFAFGNAPDGDSGSSMETVEAASTIMKGSKAA